MKCPAEIYSSSCRPYQGIQELNYLFLTHATVLVTNCGRLCLYRKKTDRVLVWLSSSRKNKEVDDGICSVSFDYDLGYIDLEEKTLQPLNNPFGPKVLPMS